MVDGTTLDLDDFASFHFNREHLLIALKVNPHTHYPTNLTNLHDIESQCLSLSLDPDTV